MQKVKSTCTKILSSFVILAALMGVGMVYSPAASADSTNTNVNCAVLPEAICKPGSKDGILVLLKWVLKTMIALVGIAAVGGVIWAGILYLSAGSDAAQVKRAKTIIIDVVIGIIAFGLMFLVLNWLIPGGVLS